MPCRRILVVSKQVALLCQFAGIDTVFLEWRDTKVCDGRRHKQRNHKGIASCNFGNEEYCHERCMHHSGHHRRHTDKCKIGRRLLRKSQLVGKHANKITRHTSNYQRGTERTSYSTTAYCGCRSNSLHQNQQEKECQYCPALVAQRCKNTMFKEHFVAAIQQFGQERIAFAEQRREKEYHHTQSNTANECPDNHILATREPILNPISNSQEIKRHKCAEHTEDRIIRNLRNLDLSDYCKSELQVIAHQEVGNRRRTNGRKHKRQNRCSRHVEHENLDNEQHTSYRGLEYSCYSTGSTTSEKQLDIVLPHPEQATHIRTDGTAR